MKKETKILVIADNENIQNNLQPVLANYSNVHYIYPTEVNKEIDRISPDIIVIHQLNATASVDMIYTIHSEMPRIQLLFTADAENFELLRDVIRAGALDFFVLPEELTLLGDRLQKLVQLIQQQNESTTNQTFKRGRGQVLSFYSGKGGEGRTLLASSFAQTLKLESTAQVVLIDLNLQFGGVETCLGVESHRSFVDLLPVANELNENHIRNVVDKETYSHLDLLLSPRDAEAAESVSDEFISTLIRACRRSYDFVIIDLPSEMTAITYTALEESDSIYYVMNLNSLSLQIYKQVEMLFKRLNIDTTDRLELVINKVSKDTELKSKDMNSFITLPVATEIRLDYKGVQSVMNKGEPLRKERGEKKLSPVAKDIRKWVLGKI